MTGRIFFHGASSFPFLFSPTWLCSEERCSKQPSPIIDIKMHMALSIIIIIIKRGSFFSFGLSNCLFLFLVALLAHGTCDVLSSRSFMAWLYSRKDFPIFSYLTHNLSDMYTIRILSMSSYSDRPKPHFTLLAEPKPKPKCSRRNRK